MKINILKVFSVFCLFLFSNVNAATFTVLPGQSIQSVFDNASTGDLIIVKAGNYNEDLTLSKNLDLRPENGAVVNLAGDLTLNGITGSFALANFIIGSANNKTLTVSNCSDVFIENIDAKTNGTGLTVTGSKVYAYSSMFKGATFNSSEWTMQECNTTGEVVSNSSDSKVLRCNIGNYFKHSAGGESNCTVYQSVVGDYIQSFAKRSWISYNKAQRVVIEGTSAFEAEIVGNELLRVSYSDGQYKIIRLNAANLTAQVRNNKIGKMWGTYGGHYWDGLYILKGVKIRIHNNIFHKIYRRGIAVDASIQSCEIVGNFFTLIGDYAVSAPFDGVTCRNNWYWDKGQINSFATGGVIAEETQEGNPLFVSYNDDASVENNDYRLQSTSPLINAGALEPEFKDHDGTRQDIGLFGGHHYDTNGTLSQKPVVLSADLAPIRIQKGITTSVKIKTRAAVSTKKQN